MTHASEEQLVLHYYGEAAERVWMDEHLAACEQCRAEYRSLQLVLNVMDAAPVPERAADYGEQVWKRVRGQVAGRTRWWWRWPVRRLGLAAAMAGLVVAAYLAGRWTPAATAPHRVALSGGERVLLVAMSDHLERAQIMLVELSNAPRTGPVDISREQEVAEDLVTTNRILRASADYAGEPALRSLLDDLERVLLEVAHSPAEASAAEMQEIRQRIEGQGILFKIRVVDQGIRQPEGPAERGKRETL